jgi:hypothetical protein
MSLRDLPQYRGERRQEVSMGGGLRHPGTLRDSPKIEL